jgi:hypothetical protein
VVLIHQSGVRLSVGAPIFRGFRVKKPKGRGQKRALEDT